MKAEIFGVSLALDHPFVGQTLEEANLRARTGASVVAILRNSHLMANPKSMTDFEAGDRIGLIGDREQIEVVKKLLEAFNQ